MHGLRAYHSISGWRGMLGTDVEGQAVVLTALLHDIGKFWQRGGAPSPKEYAAFDRSDFGAHGAHAKWSAAAYQQIVPPPWRQGAHDVLTHHLPRAYTGKIVALADHLAASERESRAIAADATRTERLQPVFSRVARESGRVAEATAYPLTPLRLDRAAIYPGSNTRADATPEYAALWDAFIAEASTIADETRFDACVVTLLALLEKYTWCVPSAAYGSTPDVSLFDHLRMTAAIAACLWKDRPAEDEVDALLADFGHRSSASKAPRFALIAGDLSGVQHFLYTLASRGAARTLRGRSLFLQLLGEAAADLSLRTLDLPPTNLVYVGGAKFYLLAPVSALDQVAVLRSTLAATFLDLFQGELYLALSAVSLSAAQVANEFETAWSDVGGELQAAKARRFAEVASASYDALFAPSGRGGAVNAGDSCDVCSRPIEDGVIHQGALLCRDCARQTPGYVPLKLCSVCRREVRDGALREGVIVCDDCEGYRELGETVTRPGARFLTISSTPLPAEAPAWQVALYRVSNRLWEVGASPRLVRPGALAYAVNDFEFRRAGAHGFRLASFVAPRVGPGEDRPDAETPPLAPGDLKDFDWLARAARGVPYLGVLRMDVDGLGAIFRSGLGAAATPSRVASLSRGLRLFFEGWLGALVDDFERETSGGREDIAVIYAGGDDLFAVGPWDRLPGLARRIRREFGAYCAGNPALTISAGIATADLHYPLYQFASDAKRALDDQAKEHVRADGRRKDALSFLDQVVAWEDYDQLETDVQELYRLVTVDGVPRALIHDFGAIYEEHQTELRREDLAARRGQGEAGWTVASWQEGHPRVAAGRLHYGRWLWLAHYQLARRTERLRPRGATIQGRVTALGKRLVTPQTIDQLGVIARWAEYLARERE